MTMLPPSFIRGSALRASSSSEYTLISIAMRKPSREVSTVRPLRSLRSAKATECTRKSRDPIRSATVANAASTPASSVTSIGTMMSEPADSASGCTRFSSASPWYVNASSAPAAAARRAIPQAIERSLATPYDQALLAGENLRCGVVIHGHAPFGWRRDRLLQTALKNSRSGPLRPSL